MHLLNAPALWLLSLILPIVLLYLLRPQRQRLQVPSSMLWRRALDSLQSRARFRRLRKNLLMILQVLALALLALSLARPFFWGRQAIKGRAIFVIDTSASMGARDGGSTRLERAQRAAFSLIDEITGNDLVAVLMSAPRPTVLTSFTGQKASLRRAVVAAQPTDHARPLKESVELALALARSSEGADIIIFTDGTDESAKELEGRSDAGRVLYKVFSGEERNVGITALDVRTNPLNPHDRPVFSAVQNFSDREVTIELELFHEGRLADAREVALQGRERRAVIFEGLDLAPGLIELRLDAADGLEADNRAYQFIPPADDLTVLLAGERNLFIEEALASHPRLKVMDHVSVPPADSASYDVTVCYGQNPERIERGRYLLINPSRPSNLFPGAAAVRKNPIISGWAADHPLAKHLDFSYMAVAEQLVLAPAEWLRPVVETDVAPLILAGETPGARVVVFAFDLLRSDLPLKSEFPVLMFNTLEWLKRADLDRPERAVSPGETVVLPGVSTAAEVILPDGRKVQFDGRGDVSNFSGTHTAGLYQIKSGERVLRLAVNLFSEAESDLSPKINPAIGPPANWVASPRGEWAVEKEIWQYAGLAVVALLLLEWWAFHRKVLA